MASRGCGTNYRRLTDHRWMWFHCLLMYRVATIVADTENVIQTTRRNWWNAAQGCEEFGGSLYIPPSLDSHHDLAAILDPGETYWIGAMEYSTWTWTSDNSPLYEHTGYTKFPVNGKPTEIEGNTAFLCHLHCGKTYTRIGLSRKSCYCLVDGYRTKMGKTATEVRCSGNYDELCGDDRGMSVYEIVDIDITQGPDGQCVYARKIRPYYLYYYSSFHSDSNCSSRRSLAFTKTGEAPSTARCRDSTCVEHGYRSWEESDARRALLKVSDANLNDLTDAMTYHSTLLYYYTYWIGLRRLYRRVWINGSDVSLENADHTDRFCLSIRKSTHNYTTLFWSLCVHRLMPVCQVARTLSCSTSGDYSTATSEPTSSPPRTPSAETATTQETDPPSPTHATSTIGSSVRLNTGTRIGISVVCVVILALTIAAFVIIKRRKLLFFGAKPTADSADGVGFDNKVYTTSQEEHVYETLPEYPGGHGQPPLPVATVRPIFHIYMNDPQTSKGEGYDVLSECSSFVPTSVKPYDRVVMGGGGTVAQGTYDRVRIKIRPEFSSNLGPDTNGSLNLKEGPGQVDDGQPEESARTDDRYPTIPGSQTSYDRPKRIAVPVYENISQCEQYSSNDADGTVKGCYYIDGQVLETETATE